MLSTEEAKAIGIAACIEKLGKGYVYQNRDNAVQAYRTDDNSVYCVVGVGLSETSFQNSNGLVLDSTSEFDQIAKCIVNLKTGEINFL